MALINSHTSVGTVCPQDPVQVARECTTPDFLKCQPLNSRALRELLDSHRGSKRRRLCSQNILKQFMNSSMPGQIWLRVTSDEMLLQVELPLKTTTP
ncbi:hypothetical protein Tco_0715244 [Tanacetum coccineum]